MIITISDMWKNQQKMLDNDNQIKLSSLIGFLAWTFTLIAGRESFYSWRRRRRRSLFVFSGYYRGTQGARC